VLDPRRLVLHLGLPKSGTTYLQRMLMLNRDALAAIGMRYPGPGKDHFTAAQEVLAAAPPAADGPWAQLRDEVRSAPDAVLVSHELLCFAPEDRIERVLALADGRPITVVLTARDIARQLPAVWQEQVKNGDRASYEAFLAAVHRQYDTGRRPPRGFWVHQDLPAILRRWGQRLPPGGTITVVTSPPSGAAPDLLWRRFAEAAGVDPAVASTAAPPRNVSLGLVETEFVRRLTVAIGDLPSDTIRPAVKGYLAEQVFAGRADAVRLRVPDEHWPWVQDAARDLVAAVRALAPTVVGDLDELLVPPLRPQGPLVPADLETQLAARAPLAIAALADRAGGRRLTKDAPITDRVLRAGRRVVRRGVDRGEP
jgi:hypothetical protein